MDMRKLEELKEKLMRELDMASSKTPMTVADISMVDTLTHAIKNLCKIIEAEEEGYSGGEWRAEGYSGRRHYVRGHYSRGGESYGRGGESYGRGNSRGSYGDESYNEGRSYREMLEREYSNARDDRERETIRRMMDRM